MKEIRLEASIGNMPKFIGFIDEALEALDAAMKAQMQIDVAADEILANICHYAYAPGTGEAVIQVDFDAEERMVTITFTDRGVSFDPLAKPDPDVTLPKRDRQIGGLGIYIVKKTMDAVEYRREGDCNVLTIRKRI